MRYGTYTIRGIPELELCRESLVRYMAIPKSRPIGAAEIAGSGELYPYLTELCPVLDEQEIPHPDIDYRSLVIRDTRKWAVFLGDPWAARHDIEKASTPGGASRGLFDD